MATIREYDPSNTSDPITKAWDSTQNKVCFKAVKGIPSYNMITTLD